MEFGILPSCEDNIHPPVCSSDGHPLIRGRPVNMLFHGSVNTTMEMNRPWNPTARDRYKRPDNVTQSDVTDQQWALIEPMLPPHHLHAGGLHCHPVQRCHSCRTPSRPSPPCRTTSMPGRSMACVDHHPCCPVAVTVRQPRASWTVRASRPPHAGVREATMRARRSRVASVTALSMSRAVRLLCRHPGP